MLSRQKKWVIYWLMSVFGFLTLTMTANYIIDPLQQFRAAFLYTLNFENERYLNAGLAKTYPYDSVVIGSSMTENFYINDLKNTVGFQKPIKLCLRGGNAYEEALTLQTAFDHQVIHNVLIGIDSYSFDLNAKEVTSADPFFPLYLYENTVKSRLKYLTNTKILNRGIKNLIKPYNAEQYAKNYNQMYSWQSDYSSCFNEANVKGDWKRWQNNFNHLSATERSAKQKNFSNAIMIDNFKKTFLPIIHKNPKTAFYLFFPPYSLLSFKMMHYEGILDNHIEFKKEVFNLLKPYPNVRLFDFQSMNDITADLKNYKDSTHYSDQINRRILEEIDQNRFRVHEAVYDESTKNFKQQIENLNIDHLFQNSFQIRE